MRRTGSDSAMNFGSGDALAALTYRSRAVTAMAEPDLRELERQSQARNRREGLTGLACYENGRFFQWLEGPADALSRVWDSVRRDARHTAIEGVTAMPTAARLFNGWDMRLAVRGIAPGEPPAPPVSPTPPQSLRSALSALDLDAVLAAVPSAELGKTATAVPVLPLVPVLVEALVLPTLSSERSTVRRFLPRALPAAARLARLLLADDAGSAEALLRRLHDKAGSLAPLCATVIEPAARTLGDLWSTDDCSQIAVTLGLCRLQSVVRQLAQGSGAKPIGGAVVLIAPQPGEAHLLGAALDTELLREAGWAAHSEFPDTDEALRSMVADTWFDALDLSLSPAMPREDSMPAMAVTIAGARLASRNPALAIVVGGRAFFDDAGCSATVGADASVSSALHLVLALTRAVQTAVTKQAQRSALVTRA